MSTNILQCLLFSVESINAFHSPVPLDAGIPISCLLRQPKAKLKSENAYSQNRGTGFNYCPLQVHYTPPPSALICGLEFHASHIICSYCSIEAALVIGRVKPRAFSASVIVVVFQRFTPQINDGTSSLTHYHF